MTYIFVFNLFLDLIINVAGGFVMGGIEDRKIS